MRGRRNVALAAGAALLVVAVVVLVAATSGRSSSGASASTAAASTSTTKVKRQDLVETESADGTLGYSDARDVVNHRSGTVTWLPEEGSVVRPGQTLYKVDGQPVILMDGRSPVYRELSASSSGSGGDVRQLERDLRRLGYDDDHDMTVDGEWDSGTTAALVDWQEDHDFDADGSVELGEIVFAPGWRRVTSVSASLGASADGATTDTGAGAAGTGAGTAGTGAAASSAVMTTSSNRQVVTVDLETSKASLATQGARVSVDMPTGPDVEGRITQVGTVATIESADSESESATATIEVTIRMSSAGSALDQAPVTVTFERSRVKDALAIPVTALLAQPGGRFAVEVVEGTKRRLLSVTPGIHASGFVQIEGDGLEPGMSVTNAAVQ